MQREVPGDPGAGTSSYWVMPSNTATKNSTIFRDRVITELIYLLISAAMVSMMSRRLIWIHFFYHFLAIPLYHEFLSQLNCHFDIAFFEHYLLQTTTAAKQANEILWNFTYPQIPRNTTRKIANLYIEFNYHFLTLQKQIPLLLNMSVHSPRPLFNIYFMKQWCFTNIQKDNSVSLWSLFGAWYQTGFELMSAAT